MSFNELYQELILDHNRSPRNFRVIEAADRRAEGRNPLCGDQLTLYLKLDGERIAEATFQGSGCAISTASASLMTQAVRGMTLTEADAMFARFRHMVTGEPLPEGTLPVDMEKLEAFAGVGDYPARVKCATLAWHTLHAAVTGAGVPVSTE